MTGDKALHFSDEVTLSASREAVWDVLNDAQAVGQCVPGLREVEVYDDGRSFGGTARIALGANALSFPARVTWMEREAPNGGRLQAFVTFAGYEIVGNGAVQLAPSGNGGVVLSWTADVALPEKLGDNALMLQMARSFAGRFIQEFFRCLQARLASV